MDLVGSNGVFVVLFFFHSVIGFLGFYRMRVRQTVDNPDSQFVAMPQTITPAGIELNPQTEPIQDPSPIIETNSNTETTLKYESVENNKNITEPSDENK